MNDTSMMVFSGNANLALSDGIVKKLNMRLGMAAVGRFSDGEIAVEIEEKVRGKDVFIIQPTCSPPNENLMELLIMIDAARRASAERITAVLPFFGSVIIVQSSFRTTELQEMIEAATVDGASRLPILFSVIIPNIRSGIMVLVSLLLISSLKVFDIMWVVTRNGPGIATDVLATT